jgi:hypothetical protein
MRNGMIGVRQRFHAGRMLLDYQQQYYEPMAERSNLIQQNVYVDIRKLIAWKAKVEAAWPGLSVLQAKWHDTANKAMPLGESMSPKISLNLNGLTLGDLGVEMLVIAKRKQPSDPFSVLKCTELSGVSTGAEEATWTGSVRMQKPGVYEYGFRIFPKHPMLAHRQDFSLIKWV